ncbi:MAG: alpha/beta hydrolase [Clostridia bacterium]|nr:alpha/beta hydrolase [Clostridia bacterium]
MDMNKTLGECLSDPRIAPIAGDAIRCMDLKSEPMWDKTLLQLREEHFGGDLARGFDRLFAAAEAGGWYFPLYTEEECAGKPDRRGVSVVWLPSEDEKAGERPYILLVPGGGFVNVWNLTEGWPVAAQFNGLGYDVAILTYQVTGEDGLLAREMEDFARGIRLVRDSLRRGSANADRYITCGFSAGGYLVCLWNVTDRGYALHGLPGPQACFPIYPVVTWKRDIRYEPGYSEWLFDCDMDTAVNSTFEVAAHAEGFPPCAIFLAGDDELVNPENSRMLARALGALGIPCRLEVGPQGGHGFADGTGMCMAGWTERAVRWYEGLTAAKED